MIGIAGILTLITGHLTDEDRAESYEQLISQLEGVDDVNSWHEKDRGLPRTRIDITADTVDYQEMCGLLRESLRIFLSKAYTAADEILALVVYSRDGQMAVTPGDLGLNSDSVDDLRGHLNAQ